MSHSFMEPLSYTIYMCDNLQIEITCGVWRDSYWKYRNNYVTCGAEGKSIIKWAEDHVINDFPNEIELTNQEIYKPSKNERHEGISNE